MSATLPGIFACFFYLASSTIQALGLTRSIPSQRLWVIGMGCLAIALHAVSVYGEIRTPTGINLGIYPMASVSSWVIAGLVLLSSLRKPIENLFIVLFPLAAITIVLSLIGSGSYTPRQDIGLGLLSHLLVSLLASGLLAIAAFQALLLTFQDRELKHHNIALLQALPPLQTMESLLFEFIWAGIVCLTLAILTGFLFLEDMFAQHVVHHSIITMMAWLVFAVLLWGRHQLGWRGPTAVNWTLSGFVLLLVGYFGSKLVLEIILQRA